MNDTPIVYQRRGCAQIVREYTYEAGVRNLDREIANICTQNRAQVAEGKPHAHRSLR